MAVRIVLEIRDDMQTHLAGLSNQKLEQLLRDALGEFIAARGNGDAVAYINKRYPDTGVAARARKAEEVTTRLLWAQAVSSADVKHLYTIDPREDQ